MRVCRVSCGTRFRCKARRLLAVHHKFLRHSTPGLHRLAYCDTMIEWSDQRHRLGQNQWCPGSKTVQSLPQILMLILPSCTNTLSSYPPASSECPSSACHVASEALPWPVLVDIPRDSRRIVCHINFRSVWAQEV